jgi:hypothetical protein
MPTCPVLNRCGLKTKDEENVYLAVIVQGADDKLGQNLRTHLTQ